MVVADRTGLVHIIDKGLQEESFLAYESGRVTHMKQLKQRNILVTVGEEEGAVQVIRLWDLDKPDRNKPGPTLERSIRINQTGSAFPVSALAVLENLSQIAVGLANGTVVLISGDLMRERTTAQKIVHQNDEPITGLGFREQQRGALLYIATTAKVLLYNTFTKNTQTLDDHGGGLGCAVMNESTQELAIARDEAIFFYGPDGRGPAYAYDGPKTSISFYKSYLVLVSPPNIPAAASRTFGVNSAAVSANDTTRLTIIDTANKFTAYQATFTQGIRSVICEWGSIYIVENGGKVYRLDEMETSAKLDILFKKNMYLLAINLAHNQKYDNASISEIIKKYGDHLYNKGDYDGAMAQYIRTIGRLEPSYVIRKFLDAQRIYNLTSYLQELHSSGLANADHTTLLLNCYTKLKDVKRLDEFIKTDSDLTFDLETAIQVCRQAGYYEHAVYLAEKFEEHDLYLTVQIDDVKQYNRALAYMRRLGPIEADKNLQKYGKVMLTHLPEQTTQLLVDLCSGTLVRNNTSTSTPGTTSPVINHPTNAPHAGFSMLPFAMGGTGGASSPPVSTSASASPNIAGHATFPAKSRGGHHHESAKYAPPSPRTFMSLFVDLPSYLITFLEKVSANRWPSSSGAHSSQSTLVSSGNSHKSPTGTNTSTRPGNVGSAGNNVLGVKKTAGSAEFSDHASTSGASRFGATSEQDMEERKAVWNTLLELYLADPPMALSEQGSKGSTMQVAEMNRRMKERNIKKEKCLKLLNETEISYDTNHALVLCHMAGFDEGIVFLYERMKMYTDILRLWIERDNTAKVIECLRKYGPLEPSLYPLTLSYFSSSPGRLTSATPELLKVLDHIDQQDLLPPLQVVQALSQTSVATIGMIKNYIGRRIEAERKERLEDHKQIQSYRQESEKKRREIEELKTSARVFQATKCSACGGSLDLPAVHFLCKHSYHQRCLSDAADRECPKCMVEQRTVADIRRMQEANAEKHDLFLSEVRRVL
ncbi:hypothetical protein BC939DRAFT_217617 [Gamsiella multidivaricata]|uniref:uncharacterized protein n=1 Tax=Gamsiella multidivaricata TaxID=101098 RepID=UPI00221EC5FA|nr:uncharacterized protein BC939DRAFT_217617 [Gamsiella multidivaricata]KAI7820795.1 hypothetical protein BC939DRAFT_217617 [Gamsiella multidivaricata]